MNTETDDLLTPPQRRIDWWLPILKWLPRYNWGSSFSGDAVAGLALAALVIPESMGYAAVAGVPSQVGLYAALASLLVYTLTGKSSVLVVGPAASVAAMSASVVGNLGSDVDPVAVTAALAITSGLLLVIAGTLRMGWIVNFISRPVLHAFVAGLSISIIAGQLDSLVGSGAKGENAIGKIGAVLGDIGNWSATTVAVGFSALIALIVLERVAPRLPATVVVVVVGILAVIVFDLPDHGVGVVDKIPSGLPDLGIPQLSGVRWLELLGGGAALLLVGFSEGYAAGSAVAESTGETTDADQELYSTGAANIASGLFGGVGVGGSLSKTSCALSSGATSQIANLVAAVVVLGSLLFLAPVFENLPEPVLAAVVIHAVLHSANPMRVVRLWNLNRIDFAAGMVTFVLVLVWEALPALIVGVALSLVFVVRRASFPDVVELRRSKNGRWFEVGSDLAETHKVDGVGVIRFEGPVIYANADRLRIASLNLLKQRPDITKLVVDAEMVTDFDISGVEMLESLDDRLAKMGITLYIGNGHLRARELYRRSGLMERFDGRIIVGVEDLDPDNATSAPPSAQ